MEREQAISKRRSLESRSRALVQTQLAQEY
jgi:hypothetical protein